MQIVWAAADSGEEEPPGRWCLGGRALRRPPPLPAASALRHWLGTWKGNTEEVNANEDRLDWNRGSHLSSPRGSGALQKQPRSSWDR